MRRLLVKGVFDFPTLMVQQDQLLGGVSRGIQQAGQQDVVLATIDPLGVLMGVADDPHQQTVTVRSAVAGAGV